jgi:hypothetical protein
MKLTHFTLLSVGTMMVLSGCYERGKLAPPSENKHLKKKQAKEKVYDFPVLKLSAKANDTESPEEIIKKKTTPKQNVQKGTISDSNVLRFPNMPKKSVETSTVNINTHLMQESTLPKDQKVIKNLSKKSVNTPNSMARIESKKEAIKQVIAQTKKLQQKNTENINNTQKPKLQQETQRKIKPQRRPRKSTSSSQIPILSSIVKPDISLQEIPILNKILPKPSEASKRRIRKRQPHLSTPTVQSNRNTSIPVLDNTHPSNNHAIPVSFSGGTSSSGLDMAKIRIETDNYQTNIVLDSYKWVGYNAIPTEASPVSGTYFFRYEPSNNRIVANIKGYNTFSALLTKQDELLKNNPMIKSIYIDRYIGDDGIKFIIELKKKAKVNVIDVEDPGSIIVELYPLDSK